MTPTSSLNLVVVTAVRVLPLPRPLPLAAPAGPYWPHPTSSARAPAVAAFGHQTTPPRPPVAVLRHPGAPLPPAAIGLRPRARSTRRARASAALTAAPLPRPLLPPSAPVPCAVAIPVLRPVGARRAPPWSPTPLLRRSAGSARPCGAPERAGAGHRCARARSGDNRAAMRPKTARPPGANDMGPHPQNGFIKKKN